MRSEKPYTKSENVILRKLDLTRFGQKISIFSFQRKNIESIAINILTRVQILSDDSTSNYSEKYGRFTTNRNHTQSRQCSRQTRFPSFIYDCLLSHLMLSVIKH